MSNILVLGGAGFIGANIVRCLVQAGNCITVIDRVDVDLTRLTSVLKDITLYKIPLTKIHKIKIVIEENKIDTVIHLISSLLPSSSFNNYLKEYKEVILPTLKLINLLSSMQLKLIYMSSGGTVYGLGRNGIFKETDTCEPITYYGQSKKIIEEYIMFANRKYCLEYLILRPSNPYGRYQSLRGNQGFISVVLGKVINSEPIELWGDGSIIRDYIYIDDFLKIFSFLLKNDLFNRIINVGSGSGHTLIEVINIIKDVTGKSAIINIMPPRNVDVPKMILDIGLLSEMFKFEFTTLESGICKYYKLIRYNDAQ